VWWRKKRRNFFEKKKEFFKKRKFISFTFKNSLKMATPAAEVIQNVGEIVLSGGNLEEYTNGKNFTCMYQELGGKGPNCVSDKTNVPLFFHFFHRCERHHRVAHEFSLTAMCAKIVKIPTIYKRFEGDRIVYYVVDGNGIYVPCDLPADTSEFKLLDWDESCDVNWV
jgi:hypothetical protein